MSQNPMLDSAEREVRAASALFQAGLLPECHRSMLRALRAVLEAWVPGGEATDGSRVDAALAAIGKTRYSRAEQLRAVLAKVDLDAGAGDAAAELPQDFERTWLDIERLIRFSARALRPERVRRRRRFALIGAGAALLLGLIFAGYGLWGRVRVRASALYSPDRPAAYAVDGILATEWLLPDQKPGWLDVYFPRARRIDGVRLLNGHNTFFLDRASRRVRVTAFSEHEQLGSAEGEFGALKDGRSPLDLKLKAKDATRLRVEVLSWFGTGAALAEVEVF